MVSRAARRKPKGGLYWALTFTGKPVQMQDFRNGPDDMAWAWGNYFDSRKEAEQAAELVNNVFLGSGLKTKQLLEMKEGEALMVEMGDSKERFKWSKQIYKLSSMRMGDWMTRTDGLKLTITRLDAHSIAQKRAKRAERTRTPQNA